ncbi:MAG: hypothetical protein WBV85_11835 [Solirubrobacteraceae bacterium]
MRVAEAQDPQERARPVGLSQCQTHLHSEKIWRGLSPSTRNWDSFSSAYATARNGRLSQPLGSEQIPRHTVHEKIAATLGISWWSEQMPLSDRQAGIVVEALQAEPSRTGVWINQLSSKELNALLADVETGSTFTRIARAMTVDTVPTRDLLAVWRTSGLATFGYVLLGRTDDPEREGKWAVSRHVNRKQLKVLLRIELQFPDPIERLSQLLRGGFADSTERRRSFVSALRDAQPNIQARWITGTLLPAAELGTDTLAAFIREQPGLFAEAWGVPDELREPFRQALDRRRRGRIVRLLGA